MRVLLKVRKHFDQTLRLLLSERVLLHHVADVEDGAQNVNAADLLLLNLQ